MYISLCLLNLGFRVLLKLIKNDSKIEGYRGNIQKSIAFQSTNDKQMEFEIKNTVPFTLVPPKMKYV